MAGPEGPSRTQGTPAPRPPTQGTPGAAAPSRPSAQPGVVQQGVQRLVTAYNERIGGASILPVDGGFLVRGANFLTRGDLQGAIRRSGASAHTGVVQQTDQGDFFVKVVAKEGEHAVHASPEGPTDSWRNIESKFDGRAPVRPPQQAMLGPATNHMAGALVKPA